jgi:hypothetical protein
MTIVAAISPTELTNQMTDRFVDQYFEARLIDASGTTYTPGVTSDATFLGFEVVAGTAGYKRQVIKYAVADVLAYSDDGVPLTRKATLFAHDGGGTSLDFSHVALVWSTGNALTLGAVTTAPSAGVDGTYTNIPIDSTTGSGVGLTVDLTIQNSGAATTDYILTINNYGYDYVALDTVQINDGTLAGLGAITGGAGDLIFSVATVNSPTNAGDLFTIAATNGDVSLTAGNEAVFYWDVKLFGYNA